MANQEIIKYLNQYKILDRSINKKIEEKEKWQSRAMKVTPTWSDMPKGSDGENPRELAICEAMDCEIEINKLIDQLCCLRRQVKKYILETENFDERLLLILTVV